MICGFVFAVGKRRVRSPLAAPVAIRGSDCAETAATGGAHLEATLPQSVPPFPRTPGLTFEPASTTYRLDLKRAQNMQARIAPGTCFDTDLLSSDGKATTV